MYSSHSKIRKTAVVRDVRTSIYLDQEEGSPGQGRPRPGPHTVHNEQEGDLPSQTMHLSEERCLWKRVSFQRGHLLSIELCQWAGVWQR